MGYINLKRLDFKDYTMRPVESPPKEGMRQLVDLATSCGRKHQNEQTAFIHYCYTKEDERDNGTIPIYENLLFALALMRSKSADTVQEGKALIEKMLPFQNLSDEVGIGGFPIYLHEYPHCKDRLLGIRLLPVFYAILSLFHHVIGSSLKERLKQAARSLLAQALHAHREKPAPYALAFTLGIAAQALGKFLDHPSFVEQGDEVINQLGKPEKTMAWHSPEGLAELLIALQMAEVAALPPEWSTAFWSHLSNTWHRPSLAYMGPGLRENQKGEEPQATLYDLYMGFASGVYSYRAFVDHPFQLQGALIYHPPFSFPPPQQQTQGEFEGCRWFSALSGAFGICLLRKESSAAAVLEKTCQLLKIMWGDRSRAHSFVCQAGNIEAADYDWHPDGYIIMGVSLGAVPPTEDREKAREIIFFTEALEDTQITVNGLKSTTFNLHDSIAVCSAGQELILSFEMVEGDGSFIGHIMRGNRPNQMGLKGIHRLDAFDWQIFLRTVYRTSPCRIKINIQLQRAE